MLKRLAPIVGALLLVMGIPSVADAIQLGQLGRSGYIVVLDAATIDPGAVADEHARTFNAEVGFVYRHALKGYAAQLTDAQAKRLVADPRVAYVDRDIELHTFAQTVPTGVNRIDGELSPTAKINGLDERVDVDIAILDSGIDLDHPDLNVVATTNCSGGSPSKKSCADGSGDDDNGHGSHVAGIAAALDNTIGVVGVAPGARLHGVKVLNSRGSGYLNWIIAGIDWVTARAATIEIANMSLGGSGHTASYRTAIANSVAKGVVYTVAAGNERRDVYGADNTFGTSDDTQPAVFPEVATISALADADGVPGGLTATSAAFSVCTENRDDSSACFSNFSKLVVNNPVTSSGAKIDLMLPGYKIVSTYSLGRYAEISGTSQASPHAAGLAGLYIAKNGRATNAAGVYSIRQALINMGQSQTSAVGLTTHDDPDINKEFLGWGSTL